MTLLVRANLAVTSKAMARVGRRQADRSNTPLTRRAGSAKLPLPARLTSAGSPQQDTPVIERTIYLPVDISWVAVITADPRTQVDLDQSGAGTRA